MGKAQNICNPGHVWDPRLMIKGYNFILHMLHAILMLFSLPYSNPAGHPKLVSKKYRYIFLS
jgi:hypothetical protein